MPLSYDYAAAKEFCNHLGLSWFGDDYAGLVYADNEAKSLGMTQEQVDAAMRNHLWQVHTILTPKNYRFLQRVVIAFYFLTGWKII